MSKEPQLNGVRRSFGLINNWNGNETKYVGISKGKSKKVRIDLTRVVKSIVNYS